MPGLVLGIHEFVPATQDVDSRGRAAKSGLTPGHDGLGLVTLLAKMGVAP
jgi:hypothetical protein